MNPLNIHAVMSDSAYSVQVRFITDNSSGVSGKTYHYVTDIPNLKTGDFAVVMAPNFNSAVEDDDNKLPKIVRIVAVDDGITFDPQDSRACNWLVQKVDFTNYDMTQLAVKAAADEVKKAQRARMREVFKQQLMQSLTVPVAYVANPETKDTL